MLISLAFFPRIGQMKSVRRTGDCDHWSLDFFFDSLKLSWSTITSLVRWDWIICLWKTRYRVNHVMGIAVWCAEVIVQCWHRSWNISCLANSVGVNWSWRRICHLIQNFAWRARNSCEGIFLPRSSDWWWLVPEYCNSLSRWRINDPAC